MEIYLVRVNERPNKSLFVERKPNSTTNDDYIAISHVWGTPETIKPTYVDGVGEVMLSPGKKDILSLLRRKDICGDGWFWMDLFCIDQTEGASISITDQLMAIPAIYKSSRCTKVLIESPVCQGWHESAVRVISTADVDEDLFGEEEMRHGRKCPHFLFSDPWFERLWTRQEGLYGMVLEIVVLNPTGCARLQTSVSAQARRDGWISEGSALAKRTTAAFFLDDKLAYHGVLDTEKIRFQLYLDFVYRHRVDITKYGQTVAGPAPQYSPISEAWRSGRITTKPRDYVLAVFPDISGYRVPSNARKMPFQELLANALGQATAQGRSHTASKVPKGMLVEMSSKESANPWIPPEPSSISEAYDSFLGELSDKPLTATDRKFFSVARSIELLELDFSRSKIDDIKHLWATTADMLRHMVRVSPFGPCVGTARGNIQTEQGLLHQYFLHQFAPPAVEFLSKTKLDNLEFKTTGIISFERIKDISSDMFKRELQRFLVCLVCGTTLRTADEILESAEFRVISTDFGKLLALVRRESLVSMEAGNLVLISTSLWDYQGFLVGHAKTNGIVIIGRTAIPTSVFWDNVQASLQL